MGIVCTKCEELNIYKKRQSDKFNNWVTRLTKHQSDGAKKKQKKKKEKINEILDDITEGNIATQNQPNNQNKRENIFAPNKRQTQIERGNISNLNKGQTQNESPSINKRSIGIIRSVEEIKEPCVSDMVRRKSKCPIITIDIPKPKNNGSIKFVDVSHTKTPPSPKTNSTTENDPTNSVNSIDSVSLGNSAVFDADEPSLISVDVDTTPKVSIRDEMDDTDEDYEFVETNATEK